MPIAKSGRSRTDIPSHPNIIYADRGWGSDRGDWVGNDNPRASAQNTRDLRRGAADVSGRQRVVLERGEKSWG